jgi:hypothetical protein
MAKRLKTTQEIDAWDQYFAAALTASVVPGALRNCSPAILSDILEDAAKVADKMVEIRSSRDPKV